ncbi:hypothetical protein ABKV19_019172 [Rosa sericea]
MFALYPIKTGANPPPPGPVNCDTFWQCNGGETCCCWMWFRGTCRSWTCCDNFGVCCGDLIHCCPPDYPICDTERKLCLQAYGNLTMKVHECRRLEAVLGSWVQAMLLGSWVQAVLLGSHGNHDYSLPLLGIGVYLSLLALFK